MTVQCRNLFTTGAGFITTIRFYAAIDLPNRLILTIYSGESLANQIYRQNVVVLSFDWRQYGVPIITPPKVAANTQYTFVVSVDNFMDAQRYAESYSERRSFHNP
jgi:hypothetical protein